MRLVFATVLLFLATGLSSVRGQGRFWGITQQGGANNQGALFSMNADGTGAQVLYSFQSSTGSQPNGTPIATNGLLYGVTTAGGANGRGVIFSYDTVAGIYTKLYDFSKATGFAPYTGLTAGYTDGKLYGITYEGGAYGNGTLFSFDPSSNTYTDLYDLTTANGINSVGPLTLYNNVFYGQTTGGGTNNYGTFFSFDPSSNTYTDVFDFGAYDYQPTGGQMVVLGNVLYGVCTDGAYGEGELFSYSAAGGFTPLVVFGGSVGTQAYPDGITAYNNVLYGVSNYGGANYNGGIFSYDPSTSNYSELMSFVQYVPSFGDITAYNGKVFGIGNNNLYDVDLTSGAYTDLADYSSSFNLNVPYESVGSLLMAVPGVVGTTPQTITFNNIQTAYGDADFAGGATSTSGLSISYKSSNPAVATIQNGKIHIVGAGTCGITASQGGNATYAAAPDVTDTLTVTPANLTITADDTVKNQLQPNPVFRLTYSGFVYSDDPSSLLTPAVGGTTATQNSPQGTYPITVSGATSNNYSITYQSGVLTIIGEYQAITLGNIVSTYGAADFSPGGVATSGLPITYTSSNPGIATVTAGEELHVVGAGTDTIFASQPGNAQWVATLDTVLLTVNPATLTIVVADATKVYLQPNPVFTATFTGLTGGDDPTNIGAVFSTTADGQDAYPGSYLINVALGAAVNGDYTITSYTSGILTIAPTTGISQNGLETYFSGPATLQVNVYALAAQQGVIQVFDVLGHQLLNTTVSLNQGFNPNTLPMGNAAAGVYIVRVTGDSLQLTQKITKL